MSTLVVDGHNDLPWKLRELGRLDLAEVDLAAGLPEACTDLPRLRSGGVGGQFWSVFVPCSMSGESAVTATLEQIDVVHRLLAAYPEDLVLCETADELTTALQTGRVGSLLGMEGGHSIDSSIGTLRMMHRLGVRYLTLTHNENVPWADSATDDPVIGGLSDFGRDVVREMNRIGMFVDLSHVSADVMRDALDTTTAPVIFSHSSARAVCSHPRNAPDDVLSRLPTNGGVCMVTFVSAFVSQPWADWYFEGLDLVRSRGGDPRSHEDVEAMSKQRLVSAPPAPTVADVADHVDHIREVAGIDHIGLGGDFDGTRLLPTGLEDVSGYPRLFDELRSRGYAAADLTKIGHQNLLRAMRGMQAAAAASG